MRDSDTYLAIIDEGREVEAKRLLLRMGQKRFGAPDETVLTRLNAISDLERLERMHDRALEAAHWQDVIETL